MINNFITQSIIRGFNAINGGNLFRFVEEMKVINQPTRNNNDTKLTKYLNSWGCSGSISQMPLMTKKDIKRKISSLKLKNAYKKFYTGGSTGEPLMIVYSKNRSIIRAASALYYNGLAGYKLGDSFLIVRSRNRNRLVKYLKNETLFIPENLSEESIDGLWEKIVRDRIRFLVGYPSVFSEICSFLNKKKKKKKRHHSIKAIISTAEPLVSDEAKMLADTFNCIVLNRYANEENGIIAQQHTFGGELFVERYGLYVEVVDSNTLLPVKKGESGKVVVTDYYSDLFPVIRYDTGDYAVAGRYDNNGHLLTLYEINGRIVDQFRKTNGEVFSPLTLGPYIRRPLTNLGLYAQFQFAQLSKYSFELRIKTDMPDIPEQTKTEISLGLKKVLGKEAEVSIVIKDEIKRFNSGKRPLYVYEAPKH